MTGSDRTPEVPVVIVGAGPAGLVAAITLARYGVGSLLVERHPAAPLPRATVVSTRTMELLRSWGLRGRGPGRAARRRMAAAHRRHARSEAAEGRRSRSASRTRTQARSQPDHARRACPRTIWSRSCSTTCAGSRRAEVALRHRAWTTLGQDGDGVHGHAPASPDRRRPARPRRLVVGADGAHSRVRARAGHRHGRRRPPGRAPHGAVPGAAGRRGRRPPLRHLLRHRPRGGRASSCPTARATAGCTAGPGTPRASGWRTTPTPGSPASSAPRPAWPTCRSGSWPCARSRSRPGRRALPARAASSWSATPPSA